MLLMRTEVRAPLASGFRCHEIADDFGHVVDLLGSETGVSAEEKRLVHDAVGLRQLSGTTNALRTISFQLHERRLTHEIATKEHTVADFVLIEVTNQFSSREGSTFFERDFETKPGAVGATSGIVPREMGVRWCKVGRSKVRRWRNPSGGMGRQRELEIFFQAMEAATKSFPIALSCFNKIGESLQLNTTDSGLGIERLQVES